MKFFELKKGQAFNFNDLQGQTFISAGVDGAYGRYVSEYSDWRDHDEWCYCDPVDEVTPDE